jgi:hypothetical protein
VDAGKVPERQRAHHERQAPEQPQRVAYADVDTRHGDHRRFTADDRQCRHDGANQQDADSGNGFGP